MSGTTVEGRDALGLVHIKGGTKKGGIVVVLQIAIATLAVELLADIIAGIELATVFQSIDGQLFDVLHRKIQVFPVVTVVGMAIIFHLKGLVVFATGVVHYHYEGAIQRTAYRFLIERLRRVFLHGGDGLAVFILEGIAEFLNRLAQGDHQHMIYLAEHLSLTLLDVFGLLAVGHHTAQFQALLTQLRLHQL